MLGAHTGSAVSGDYELPDTVYIDRQGQRDWGKGWSINYRSSEMALLQNIEQLVTPVGQSIEAYFFEVYFLGSPVNIVPGTITRSENHCLFISNA